MAVAGARADQVLGDLPREEVLEVHRVVDAGLSLAVGGADVRPLGKDPLTLRLDLLGGGKDWRFLRPRC